MHTLSGACGINPSTVLFSTSCNSPVLDAIRFCHRHENQIRADLMARSLAQKKYSSFWKSVSNSVTPRTAFPNMIGSATGHNAIGQLWFNHYNDLFNSVGYSSSTMDNLLSTVTDSDEVKLVSAKEVTDTLSCLSNNKAADCYGLRSEHFRYAGELFCSFLAMCYNLMLTHSYIPAEATQTVICPTVKDKMAHFLMFLTTVLLP